MNAIDLAANHAEDTLLIYFAGHGLVDLRDGQSLYLALYDARADRLWSSINYKWIRQTIERSAARRKIVILDCCYSARAMGPGRSSAEGLASQADIVGTCVLVASSENRLALAPAGEMYTAFTGELIRIIEQGVRGGPKVLDMDTLFRELDSRLVARNRPRPQQGSRNAGGSIAIARNRAFVPSRTIETSDAASPEVRSNASDRRLVKRVAPLLTALAVLVGLSGPRLGKAGEHDPTTGDSSMMQVVATVDADLVEPTFSTYSAAARDSVIYAANLVRHDRLRILAADAQTGVVKWTEAQPLNLRPGQATTVALSIGADVIYVAVRQTDQQTLRVFDTATGRNLWNLSAGSIYSAVDLGRNRISVAWENAGVDNGGSRSGVLDTRTGRSVWAPGPPKQYWHRTLPIRQEPQNTAWMDFGMWDLAVARAGPPFSESVLDVSDKLHRRDVETGRVRQSTMVPPDVSRCAQNQCSYGVEMLALDGTLMVTFFPNDFANNKASVKAFDLNNGAERWSRDFWIGDDYFNPAVACGARLVCVQSLDEGKLTVRPFDYLTGMAFRPLELGPWRTEAYRILSIWEDNTAMIRRQANVTGGWAVVVANFKAGAILYQNAGWFPLVLDGGKLILLRGQLDGPDIDSTDVRMVDLATGREDSMAQIETAAMLCTAAGPRLACPAESGRIQILEPKVGG